jgi:solute:Na+ symporter, SSS family
VNAGVKAGGDNTQLSVPLLFEHMFPSWFAGIGYSAIIIGALVPAAIMSIASANLFTRNIYKEFIRRGAGPAEQTRAAQWASLFVKLGALIFALELSKTFSINLQLLGGIWILQTFPAIVIGLYTRWLHRWALLIGWAAAMVYGTIEAYRTPGGGQQHFGASTAPILGHVIYIAVAAFIINLAVAIVLTVIFRAVKLPAGTDETLPAQYDANPRWRWLCPPRRGPPPPDPFIRFAPLPGPEVHN